MTSLRIPLVQRSAPPLARVRLDRTMAVFLGAAALMLGAWALLGLLYAGVAGGGSIGEARSVLSAVTSTESSSGPTTVRALLATPEYFALDQRGDRYFDLAPLRNLGIELETPGYFAAFDRSAESLAVDPGRLLPVLLTVDVHEGEIPDPSLWLAGVSLETDAGVVRPLPDYTTVLSSEHHQTLALQFPRTDDSGAALLERPDGELRLSVAGLGDDPEPLIVAWELPLQYPDPGGGSTFERVALGLLGALAVTAGLLVVFSPCAVHMTAYFLPLVTGLGMKEVLEHSGEVQFRARVASLGVAFVAGFVVLYTVIGVVAGSAGQLLADTGRIEPYLLPVRILTGGVVIAMALQTMGFFRIPFMMSLQLPGRPHEATPRRGYIAAAIAGMSISVGCLTCVGGSLLASLLLYAGASGSPLVGGLTLFLFATGMSIPFLLAAFAFEKVVPRFTRARSVLRYSTSVAAAVMLMVGLLIISGNDSIFEQLVV